MQGVGTSAAFEQAESDTLLRGNTYTVFVLCHVSAEQARSCASKV